jgi:hypothetical protein
MPDWLHRYRVLPFHSLRVCQVLAMLILDCDVAVRVSAGQVAFSFLTASTLVSCVCQR